MIRIDTTADGILVKLGFACLSYDRRMGIKTKKSPMASNSFKVAEFCPCKNAYVICHQRPGRYTRSIMSLKSGSVANFGSRLHIADVVWCSGYITGKPRQRPSACVACRCSQGLRTFCWHLHKSVQCYVWPSSAHLSHEPFFRMRVLLIFVMKSWLVSEIKFTKLQANHFAWTNSGQA